MNTHPEWSSNHEAALTGLTEYLGVGGLASVLHRAACHQRSSHLDGLVLSHPGEGDHPAYSIAVGRELSDITFNGDGPHVVPTVALYQRLAAMAAPTVED